MSFLSNVAGSYKKRVQERADEAANGLLNQLRGRLSSWGFTVPIGSLGPIIFEVSSRKVRTFRDLKRTTKARYASHDVIGQKPIVEYIGPDGEEITFVMQFSVALGIDPATETEKLRTLCESGESMYFVLCNQAVGQNRWVIEEVGESYEAVDNSGRVILSQVEITLKEYVPNTF